MSRSDRRTRRCGGCSACCVSVDGETCGCRSPSRTEGCRGFQCLWLMGFGRRDDRPDHLGVLFAPAVNDKDELGVWVFERDPGASRTERARALVDGLAARFPIIIAEDVHLAPGLSASVLTLREPPKAPAKNPRRGTLLGARTPRHLRRRR